MNLEQIDTSTTAGKAEVMRLAAEGREVVWRGRGDAQWRSGTMPEWDWTHAQYAVVIEDEVSSQFDCVAEVALSDDGYKIGLLGPLRAHRLPIGTKLYVRRATSAKEGSNVNE